MSSFSINTNKLLVENGIAKVKKNTNLNGLIISGSSFPTGVNGTYCLTNTYNGKNKYINSNNNSYYLFWATESTLLYSAWVISDIENSTSENLWHFVNLDNSITPPLTSWTNNTGTGTLNLSETDCFGYLIGQSVYKNIIP
jgi:hypothetical protein